MVSITVSILAILFASVIAEGGEFGKFREAAVTSLTQTCSNVGKDILQRNGSAVDAAIATMLCEEVAYPDSLGIGGGFLMTIYDAQKRDAVFLNAKERAPARATVNMFRGNKTLAMFGALAMGVPGQVAGFWAAHQRYGKLPWRELFLPAIKLCEEGFLLDEYSALPMQTEEAYLRAEPSLAEIFVNPKTNATWRAGDRVKRPKLKETFQSIANEGADVLYKGRIGQALINDIKSMGGIMEMVDLKNYTVQWKAPIKSTIGNDSTIYTSNIPGSGALLVFMLNVLENFIGPVHENVFWQRLIETFKWAYARRTELGDNPSPELEAFINTLISKEYAEIVRAKIEDNWTSNDAQFYGASTAPSEDSGTAHFAVLAPDGSAVSVTSSVNHAFGAMRRSRSTGIIPNSHMDDFSSPNIISGYKVPPSPANFIEPGKRPMSSMVPTIIVDNKGKAKLIIGAAGGTKITTSVALAMVLNLWNNYNIKEAIDAPRIHHQLLPMEIQAEPIFLKSILNFLSGINHKIRTWNATTEGSGVSAIARYNESIVTAYGESRRNGGAAGF